MNLEGKTKEQLMKKLEIVNIDLEGAHNALKYLNPNSVLGYLGLTASIRRLEKNKRKILDAISELEEAKAS